MGGLDLLIGNFSSRKSELRTASARLLEQSLTPENCNYVVEKGFDCLDKVVKVNPSFSSPRLSSDAI